MGHADRDRNKSMPYSANRAELLMMMALRLARGTVYLIVYC